MAVAQDTLSEDNASEAQQVNRPGGMHPFRACDVLS